MLGLDAAGKTSAWAAMYRTVSELARSDPLQAQAGSVCDHDPHSRLVRLVLWLSGADSAATSRQ